MCVEGGKGPGEGVRGRGYRSWGDLVGRGDTGTVEEGRREKGETDLGGSAARGDSSEAEGGYAVGPASLPGPREGIPALGGIGRELCILIAVNECF